MKPCKSILDNAISVCLALWVFLCFAIGYFGLNRPRAPVVSEGRVFPFHIWGTVVYLTRAEYAIAGYSLYYFAVLALLFGIKYRRHLKDPN